MGQRYLSKMATSMVQSSVSVLVLLCTVLNTCGAHVARLSVSCVDNPSIDCADLNNTAQICTAFPDSEDTRTFCPKYCGLCDNESHHVQTSTPSVQGVATTTAPASAAKATATSATYTGACVDDPEFKCADMDHTAKICTLYRNDPTTIQYCPKYCGLCGGSHSSTQSASASTAAATSAAFTGDCTDNPAFKCADMDKTAKICTVYRGNQQTRDNCPKYCGLCSDTPHPSTQSAPASTAAATSAAFTGPCIDNPAFKCADMDKTAKICTVYRGNQQTRDNCPKYCGLCSDSPHPSTQSAPASTAAATSAAFTGPCIDNPAFKCADMDKTAKICTVYRGNQQTRDNCPKYCGLCSDSNGPVTTQAIVTSVTTQTPFSGPCQDNIRLDCADLDKNLHICTDFIDNPDTRKNCPKYCGICKPVTGAVCMDSPAIDCADLNRTAQICTLNRDSQNTRDFCPKYCGLCSEGTATSGSIGPSTIITSTQTPRLSESTTSKQITTSSVPLGLTSTEQPHSDMTTSMPPTFTTLSAVTTTPKHLTASSTTTSKYFHMTTSAYTAPSTQGYTDISTNPQSTLGPSESTTTPSLQTALSLAFHSQDHNRDGVISFLEFEELWKLIDQNGDDRVTLDEYAATTHFSKYVSEELFQFIDHDHNNVITIQEVPRIFLEFDSNYDGKIEEDEYIVEYTRMYKFIKSILH